MPREQRKYTPKGPEEKPFLEYFFSDEDRAMVTLLISSGLAAAGYALAILGLYSFIISGAGLPLLVGALILAAVFTAASIGISKYYKHLEKQKHQANIEKSFEPNCMPKEDPPDPTSPRPGNTSKIHGNHHDALSRSESHENEGEKNERDENEGEREREKKKNI